MRYRSVSEPSLHGIVILQRTAVWTQPKLITQCIELRPRREGGQNHRADKETEMWVWVKNSLWDRRESEQFRLGRPEHVLKRFRRKREWGGGMREDGGGRVAGDLREASLKGSRDNSPSVHRATEELSHACYVPSPNPLPPPPSLLQIKALLPLSPFQRPSFSISLCLLQKPHTLTALQTDQMQPTIFK